MQSFSWEQGEETRLHTQLISVCAALSRFTYCLGLRLLELERKTWHTGSLVPSSSDLLGLSDFLLRKPSLLLRAWPPPPEICTLEIVRRQHIRKLTCTTHIPLSVSFPKEWQPGPKVRSGPKKYQKGMCLEQKPARPWNTKNCWTGINWQHGGAPPTIEIMLFLPLEHFLAGKLAQAFEQSNSLWNGRVRSARKG